MARALGDEMTGEPAMLAIGWDEDMDVTPPTRKNLEEISNVLERCFLRKYVRGTEKYLEFCN